MAQIICGWFKEQPMGRARKSDEVSGRVRMKLLRLCLTLSAMLAAPGAALAQMDYSAGKSAPQLFASDCSACHQSPGGSPKAATRLHSRVFCASTIQPEGHLPDCLQTTCRACLLAASRRRVLRKRLAPLQPRPRAARRGRPPRSKPSVQSPVRRANPSRRKPSAKPPSRQRRRPTASPPSRRTSIHCRPSRAAYATTGRAGDPSCGPAAPANARVSAASAAPACGRSRQSRGRARLRPLPNAAPACDQLSQAQPSQSDASAPDRPSCTSSSSEAVSCSVLVLSLRALRVLLPLEEHGGAAAAAFGVLRCFATEPDVLAARLALRLVGVARNANLDRDLDLRVQRHRHDV